MGKKAESTASRIEELFEAVKTIAREAHGDEVPDYVVGILNGIAACSTYLCGKAKEDGMSAETLANNTLCVTRDMVDPDPLHGLLRSFFEVMRNE